MRRHDERNDNGTTQLASEFDRARRYGHRLALVKLAADGPDLDRVVRACDKEVTVNGSAYLMLPETDGAGAASLLGRLGASPTESDSPAVGIAVFPDDGYTANAVLAECDDDRSTAALMAEWSRPEADDPERHLTLVGSPMRRGSDR